MEKKIPKHYQTVKEYHPDYIAAFENLKEAAKTAGPLDESLGQFIKLAASIAIKSEGATHSHARQLVELGFTPEEIRHAVLMLTTTIGFPNTMAGMTWVNDVLEEK